MKPKPKTEQKRHVAEVTLLKVLASEEILAKTQELKLKCLLKAGPNSAR